MEMWEIGLLQESWLEYPPVHVSVRAALGAKVKIRNGTHRKMPSLSDMEKAIRAMKARMN